MTIALITLCALLHTIGSVIGACYTTFAEIFYIKAASDGDIDKHERKYLRRLYRGLHLGMFIVLFTGIALAVLQYAVPDAPNGMIVAPFWAVESITLAMILFGYALSKRHAPWWAASAAILTGWWMLVCIDFGLFNTIGYLPIILTYLFASVVVAAIVGYVRIWVWHPKKL